MIPLWLTFATELRGILQQTFPGELGDLYSCCAELLSGNADLASTTNLRPKLDNASKLFGTYANANFPSWPQSLTDQNAIDWSAYTDNPMLDGLSDLHTIVENLREVVRIPSCSQLWLTHHLGSETLSPTRTNLCACRPIRSGQDNAVTCYWRGLLVLLPRDARRRRTHQAGLHLLS